MGKSLVIVESPAKARTIERYLGEGFRVEASVGHIRDLPRSAAEIPTAKKKLKWARLGVNVEKDFSPLYIVPSEKKEHVKMLKEALKEVDQLYLATDEDREGESISWHLMEVLKPKVPVRRLVFHEITKEAIQRALQSPREVNLDLVKAQETRRIVDRLFGYEVSPLLWKKIRPKLSAGRVQSVAVRLVVERERERRAFTPAGWWDVAGTFATTDGVAVDATLTHWKGERVATGKDFGEDGKLKPKATVTVLDKATAQAIVEGLKDGTATVKAVEPKPYSDKPSPPFTTSTLQQEANRKQRWTARRTMSVAQRLYENGWITYMRTDSTTLSKQAVQAARSLIKSQYGASYLHDSVRVYKSKAKNAQEAHEAIRPAGSTFRTLADARKQLSADEALLYELIWKRTVACQMTNATGKYITMKLGLGDAELVARGKTIEFAGYRRAYVEGSDNPDSELADQERVLPDLKAGNTLQTADLEAKGHETRPPARLTEASLVRQLEAKGIGRPSTYASIIDTILRRKYVFKKGSALVPTFTAFAVTALLEQHLSWLVDYAFTAEMENRLDDIAVGQHDARTYLKSFYLGDAGLKDRLADAADEIDPRTVCTIPVGTDESGEQIDVRVGRYGPFLSAGDIRADIPDDLPPDELDLAFAKQMIQKRKDGPTVLGDHPEKGEPVYLLEGRFGPYLQLGGLARDENGVLKAVVGKNKEKPPRAGLLRGMEPKDVTLDLALQLLSLPREVGSHPETGEPVLVANGRYGPYVKSGTTSRSLAPTDNVLTVGFERAMVVLNQPARRARGPQPLKELGTDARTDRPVVLMKGRFGPYVTDGETNASLPSEMDPLGLDLEGAIELLIKRENAPKRPKPGKKATTARKTTSKKTTSKKTTSKKTTAKKATAKKTTAKKKPAAKKTTATKKPAAKKTTGTKKA